MSNLAEANIQSDLDIAPPLLPAQVLGTDAQALDAARELAAVARQQAARRDQQRNCPGRKSSSSPTAVWAASAWSRARWPSDFPRHPG